jgi:hypothetical protein
MLFERGEQKGLSVWMWGECFLEETWPGISWDTHHFFRPSFLELGVLPESVALYISRYVRVVLMRAAPSAVYNPPFVLIDIYRWW